MHTSIIQVKGCRQYFRVVQLIYDFLHMNSLAALQDCYEVSLITTLTHASYNKPRAATTQKSYTRSKTTGVTDTFFCSLTYYIDKSTSNNQHKAHPAASPKDEIPPSDGTIVSIQSLVLVTSLRIEFDLKLRTETVILNFQQSPYGKTIGGRRLRKNK